jgi:hypothetical protein
MTGFAEAEGLFGACAQKSEELHAESMLHLLATEEKNNDES